ncbi:MAG: hypothetical protein MI702_11845, partial [Chlorobiales bacterium]|nr:hypothetical protein [Chlorobiales bacterium]
MKYMFVISLIIFQAGGCLTQDTQSPFRLLGSCEGCEAVFEYGDQVLTSETTLPDFSNSGPKLKLTGTIYETDG